MVMSPFICGYRAALALMPSFISGRMARWNGCPARRLHSSSSCWPEILTGNLPVIYPFIVNDPGEAAQAKRRISALTLGHIPPPLRQSDAPAQFSYLESLLDEFSNADGLDPKRVSG